MSADHRPTLYLIDGYAQFFRAYHAIRTPMSSPVTKEPTNMTFGFVGMLLKLLRGEGKAMGDWGGRPDMIAVALDVSGDRGTFRSELYADYKANRDAPPEDLLPQIERCISILQAVGVPTIGAEGFEADDAVATIVHRLRKEHPRVRVRMVSKDKDLKQLLSAESVELFDVHTDTAFGEGELMATTGIRPDQVVDMLALMGDSTDNVPGVEGVGEKTAAMLIAEHGTLEALLAKAGEVKGKRGEKLREAAPRLALSKRLVTLRDDAPVHLDLRAAEIGNFRLDKLIPICKELGFNRYQDDVRLLMGQSPVMPASEQRGEPSTGVAVGVGRKAKSASEPIEGGLFAAHAQQTRETTFAQSGRYEAVTTIAGLRRVVEALRSARIIAVDTETTSLHPRRAKLCGVSLCVEPGRAWYVPTLSPTPHKHLDAPAVLGELRGVLEDARIAKCGHNIKFDQLIFRGQGVTLRGISKASGNDAGFDSMIASYLIDASRSSHGLDALALALLGRTNISLSELVGSGKHRKTFDTVPLEQATQYAAEDADVALQLRAIMQPQLEAAGLIPLFRDVEMPLVEALAEMEWNGILVDPKELAKQRARLEGRIGTIRGAIDAAAKAAIGRVFDPDSPKQLAAALFNKPQAEQAGLGLRPVKRTKTGYSTDAEVLEELAADGSLETPIPGLILEYRQLTKLVSTYLVALAEAIDTTTRRVHSSFHQTVAATGRLASSDPNLQNIPIRTDVGRDIRRAFVAPPGRVLVTADYSQIELRLLAHLSRDPALIEAFRQDADIHTAVAAQIAGKDPKDVTREERGGAKMVNFGIVYGITPYGLARRLKIDEKQAAEIITGYKRRFAGITTFLQECVEQARDKGFVTTILGRRRPIPEIQSKNPSQRALAERLAINSVVQGSAADLIKLAMVNLRAARSPKPFLILLQIHDELVFECDLADAPDVKAFVVAGMENAMRLAVPLKVDAHVASNWHEGK